MPKNSEIPSLGSLEDVNLRDAWAHEALSFTPWLAANLASISQAIGIPLELTDIEVRVQEFAADIVARNPEDNTIVLIENQLERSDHTHLGQLLTYLVGLKASTIIWIAREFSEPHLSAISWLNQNTIEPFSFFAVRVRAVRIGTSPIAPVFEVLERPNDWDRKLQNLVRSSDMTPLGKLRLEFWSHFLTRFPEESLESPPSAGGARWRSAGASGLVVTQYFAKSGVGIFVRGKTRMTAEETETRLLPRKEQLQAKLNAPLEAGGPGHYFAKEFEIDTSNRENWDSMSDWLHAETGNYIAALNALGSDQ